MSRFGKRTRVSTYVGEWISAVPKIDWYYIGALNGNMFPVFKNGTPPEVTEPTQVDETKAWSKLSTSAYVNSSTFATYPSGIGISKTVAYTWGWDIFGQTGLNTNTSTYSAGPNRLSLPSPVTDVGAGNAFQAAVANNKLYTWGLSELTGSGLTTGNTLVPTQVGTSSSWKRVEGGGYAGLALDAGKLYSWGYNTNGGTGLNTSTGTTYTITQVGTSSGWTYISNGNYGTALGIDSGKLYSWGSNSNGQTGLGLISGNTLVPTQVGTATNWTVVAAASEDNISLGIAGGKLYSWGSNSFGQTGLNTTTSNTTAPTQVGALTNWTAIKTGSRCAIGIESGKLYSWGSNNSGQTGLGLTSGNTLVPTQVGTATDWGGVGRHPTYSFSTQYYNTMYKKTVER